MEKKLRNKRIRLLAIVLILMAVAGFGISRLRVEPVDYKGSPGNSVVEVKEPIKKIEKGKKSEKDENKVDDAKQPTDGQSGDKSQPAVGENKNGESGKAGNSEYGNGSSGSGNAAGNDKNISSAGNQNNAGGGKGGNDSKEEDMITVYLSIDCYTLLGDGCFNLVDENLAQYVPANGQILKRTAYRCKQGTCVYDVLYHACRDKGIQIEASYTPLYSGYYVKGINHLYEFHGGTYSGWLYRVNDVFPNYGCSQYFLEEGDEIVWSYTCAEGDVPGTWMK